MNKLISIAAIFLAFATAANAAVNVELASIKDFVDPSYPLALPMEGIVEGTVEIIVDINDDGTLADWLPVYTTRPQFLKEVARVIDQWIFNPALKNGQPVPIVQRYILYFEYNGMMELSGPAAVAAFYNLSTRDSNGRQMVDLSELDKLPEPKHIVQPFRQMDDPNNEWVGTVEITFFIDTEGKVRLPVVTALDGNEIIGHSAYHAIKQWRFDPPIYNGKPITAKASQVFLFGTK